MVRGATALIVLGALGHLYYWYWPRLHPAQPDPQSVVAGLVAGPVGREIRLWIPFPHQNLAVAARSLGGLETVGPAAQELLGLAATNLPSFGPFRFPPAKEIVLAVDEEGRGLFAVAQIYPLAAWVFRAAGWLAGNPWMAGGDLNLGGEAVTITWRGSLWIATAREVDLASSTSSQRAGSSLALLRLGYRLGPLPEGVLRVMRERDRVVVSSSLFDRRPFPPELVGPPGRSMVMSWTRFVDAQGIQEVRSTIALSGDDGNGTGLPPVLILHKGLSGATRLPGERILEVLGVEAKSRALGPWKVRAYEEWVLDRGLDLIAWLETLCQSSEPGHDSLLGLVDLDETQRVFLAIAKTLQGVPLIGEAEARRWSALTEILAALPEGSRMTIQVVEPDRVDLEISLKPPD